MPGYFIDTSALAKLYHVEVGSQKMEALATSPGASLIVSQLSLIELQSAFAAKTRMDALQLAVAVELHRRCVGVGCFRQKPVRSGTLGRVAP